MSQLAPGSIHKFLTGETVTGDDTPIPTNLNTAFELLRLAHNDTDTKVNSLTTNVYTKAESDANTYSRTQLNAGQLDSRYYTESELNAGQLDTRYFTETEVNNALGLKADATSVYTKASLDAGQLDTRYFTETELTNGQLDGRYFTEAELLAGSLDSRYFTEAELNAGQLDTQYYTRNQLSTGQLDTRYYTEPEIDQKLTDLQAGQIVANSITNAQLVTDIKVGSLSLLTTTNKASVTGAINEVKTTADSASTAAGTAQTTANAALPKAGGALSGGVTMANGTGFTATSGGSLATGAGGATWSAKAGNSTSSALTAQASDGAVFFTAGQVGSSFKGVSTGNNTLDDGTGKMTLAGDLSILANKALTVNNWGGLSSGSNGDVLIGNNCYLDSATGQYKYRNTHASLGARGMVIRWSTDGQIYYFNMGNIATTADAVFTPTFQKMWHAGNDGAGSGLAADFLGSRTASGYALTSDKFTPTQLQNTQLQSGMYTNDGQGLLNSNGTSFKTGWYHIYHSYHAVDGYAVQVAYPYASGSAPDQNVYWRNSAAFTWGEWKKMGGGMTDIQPTYTRTASLSTGQNKTPRQWYTMVDIQNKKGMVSACYCFCNAGYFDNGGNTWSVGANINYRITIDDQVENVTSVIPSAYGMGDYYENYGYGVAFLDDRYFYGDGTPSKGQYSRQDAIYFAKNFKFEVMVDPTQSGYTNNTCNMTSNAVRYSLHVGQ